MLTPRLKLVLAAIIFLSVVLMLGKTYLSSGLTRVFAAQQERRVENKIPAHVPIKIKLKAEKEKAFKDLGNKEWHRDFALEVTNTSDKPIYYLDLWLEYPELKQDDTHTVGVVLRYGRIDFVHFDTRPIPTDVPIKPGETYTFKIPEQDQRGWQAHKKTSSTKDPIKFEITFAQLSFGDGSGFNGSDARSYPYKRDQASNGNCREGPMITPNGYRASGFSQRWTVNSPARLPVNLFLPARPRTGTVLNPTRAEMGTSPYTNRDRHYVQSSSTSHVHHSRSAWAKYSDRRC